jgi:hypothetical protein
MRFPGEEKAIRKVLEEKAIRQVLEAGDLYGYGNMIAHLKKPGLIN